MPRTWAEWKHEASILDNQWRWFNTTCPQMMMATKNPVTTSSCSMAPPSSAPPPIHLSPVGGAGDRWMGGGAEEGGAMEHDEVVTGFLVAIIIWGQVVLNHLHWLSRMEASCFHSAQVLGIGCSQ